MAATVASTQAADLSSASASAISVHRVNEPIPAANMDVSPHPLPSTRKFSPRDFKLVRTLGTGRPSVAQHPLNPL